MKQTVLVVGLGLIGGSIALALQKSPNVRVIGFDANSDTLQSAKVLGVVQDVTKNPEETAKKVDIIIFATPVNATLEWMESLKSWELPTATIVTDTGSTKSLIMEKAFELRENGITFIGGHPMAGSHKSGVLAAKPYLFENAYYMLTPLEGEDEEKINILQNLLQYTSAKLMRVSASEHDHMTSVVSHFPHIVAASLVHQLHAEGADNPITKMLAAGGFRDLTRIASSNPILWRDITMQNRQQIAGQLAEWQAEMKRVEDLLITGEATQIEDYFAKAKSVRDELPISSQGAMYMTYDLYVDVPDYPGSIAEITAYLAEEQISITNIRIVETREDVFGILVVSFQNAEDRERAAACIQKRSPYEIYIS
ncbi:prephenate dehydrogenase [Viridibacillus sp. FSL R5-0477]|uniref:Prephenate dehydrogenase n=1 Tax=Viridibacillus arenosi FSL R5-213 TaxID=1227360 RepID=W4EMA2_9BACL|nr:MULTISPECIES: prephenate dehydrogenase [Viridibacillus]ETT81142.1 prephenate dehydrogenase [Viridibacillus arenosi FSL R5-213]OMC84088.1 prephenate dehydrogenase [Viridibacillus sp. FSL H8-0123]OMC88610.1 prephenate dehydrogenase [Viridibacillus sp. FSL H7-0596]OMC93243.1 prephenate dehydrogenase [Viridibacillus arenosi]